MACAPPVSDGSMFGVLLYVFNKRITLRFRDLSPAMPVVVGLFIVKTLFTVIA